MKNGLCEALATWKEVKKLSYFKSYQPNFGQLVAQKWQKIAKTSYFSPFLSMSVISISLILTHCGLVTSYGNTYSGQYPGGGFSVGFQIGMLSTTCWLETLQWPKKGGRNYTFRQILTKSRGRNTTFS